jgi:hypothetical protein
MKFIFRGEEGASVNMIIADINMNLEQVSELEEAS